MNPYFSNNIFNIYRFKCGPYDNNAYVIVCLDTNKSLIIDTPDKPEELVEFASKTNVEMIAITHNHMDHLLGFDEVINSIKAPVAIGHSDADALPQNADILLFGNESLAIGNLIIESIATPGHTDGSICFRLDNHLFTGDTLFPGGPGKTKSPEAFKELIVSITSKLFTLPKGMMFYPGHGKEDLLDKARADYAIFSSKSYSENLYGDVEWKQSSR
jgi:glyoxylase-like metal-dependent hydrolase (beta-lactamase superfamily II)